MQGLIRKTASVVLLSLVLFTFLSILPKQTFAQEDTGGFIIKNFDSNITINKDGSLDVTETIRVDFSSSKHGIFRFLPLSTELKTLDGNRIDRRVSIDVKEVLRNGQKEKFETYINHSSNFNYKDPIFALFYDLRIIKIGDGNKTVNDVQEYEIKYTVSNPIVDDNGVKLYWGVTGNQWNVPIENSSVQVSLNNGSFNTKATCYAGKVGSSNKNVDCLSQTKEGVALSKTTNLISKGEAFNIEIEIPDGYLNKDVELKGPAQSDYTKIILDNIFVVFFIISPMFLVFGVIIHWMRCLAPKGSGVIVPLYDSPDGLRPAEVGFIYDQTVDDIDYSATIIDLAIRGYIKIEDLGKAEDFKFIRLSKTDGLSAYEQKFLDGIFSGGSEAQLSNLKNKFYRTLNQINSSLQSWVTKNGYFRTTSPKDAPSTSSIVVGVILVIIWVAVTQFLKISEAHTGLYVLFSILTIGITFLAFLTINRKTKKGVLMNEKIRGLKQYIELADKNRINMLNAPELTPQLFEKLLPYAMVFKQHKAWADKFKNIYVTPPDWYQGDWSTFSTYYLISSLTHASHSMNSVLSSSPSQSGSGFSSGGFGGSSGGGFGGGGGGSW